MNLTHPLPSPLPCTIPLGVSQLMSTARSLALDVVGASA
jgi:hypothetical protein